MAEEYSQGNQSYGHNNDQVGVGAGVHGEAATETQDRGIFDHFSRKNDEENIKLPHHDHVDDHVVHAKVEEEKQHDNCDTGEKKKHGFLEKLHRSNSSSSSSSDEEEADEEKRKKREKNGLKEKTRGEDEKGIFEKIKEKLPGADHDELNKNIEDPLTYSNQPEKTVVEDETKEKKGIFEKIKEKLPGHHHEGKEAHDSR